MARNEVDFIADFRIFAGEIPSHRCDIRRHYADCECVWRVHLRLFYSARPIAFLIRPQRDVERLFAISLIS